MAQLAVKDNPLMTALSPVERRFLLFRRAGLEQASLAGRLGCTQPAISNVLAGRSRSRRLERALARALRMRVAELFPEHYGAG